MKRRSFLAALPSAAIAPALLAQTRAAAPGAPPEPFQPAGAIGFDRPDVHAGDRPFGASFGSRSAVYGRSGAAGTAHPIATQIGIEILRKGGSAADACVAINAALGFLEPTSSGLGGDCYVLIWDPKLGKVVGLTGSGRSPEALTLEIARHARRMGRCPLWVR